MSRPQAPAPTAEFVNPYDVSAEEMAQALSLIRPTLTNRQLSALEQMYGAPDGFHATGVGHLSDALGSIGSRLTDHFGRKPDARYHLSWLAYQMQKDRRMYWHLRDNVVQAIQMVGWFEQPQRRINGAHANADDLDPAVSEVISSLSESARELLRSIAEAPNHEMSAAEAAAAIGWKHWIAANGAIGRIGRSFYERLGHPDDKRPGEFEWWHVIATGRQDAGRGFVWQLRPYVVRGLDDLSGESTRNDLPLVPPAGVRRPLVTQTSVTEHQRDERVKRWVQSNADGRCEACEAAAPFVAADGTPFLEVHHLKTLADGGSDRVSNAVAVCPNCHRELHHGRRAPELREALYQKLPRLARE
jgi:predicted HNH restriction endonuclease